MSFDFFVSFFFSLAAFLLLSSPYIRKTTVVIFHNMMPNVLTTTGTIDVRAPLVSSHQLCYDFTSAAVVVSPSSRLSNWNTERHISKVCQIEARDALGRKSGK